MVTYSTKIVLVLPMTDSTKKAKPIIIKQINYFIHQRTFINNVSRSDWTGTAGSEVFA